jgi:hypothetical protein
MSSHFDLRKSIRINLPIENMLLTSIPVKISSYKKVSEGKVHCRTMVFDGTMEYNTM